MENSDIIVNPDSPADLGIWAKRWGVSHTEVYNAILETGSLRSKILKEYVRRDKWIYHPVAETAKIIRAGFNLIF